MISLMIRLRFAIFSATQLMDPGQIWTLTFQVAETAEKKTEGCIVQICPRLLMRDRLWVGFELTAPEMRRKDTRIKRSRLMETHKIFG